MSEAAQIALCALAVIVAGAGAGLHAALRR